MATEHKTPLTCSEIGILWGNYLADTMSLYIEKVHAAHTQDTRTRALIENVVSLLEKTCPTIRELLQKEGLPIPVGFTEEDVDFAVPPLYTDIFRLQYVKYKANIRMQANGFVLTMVTRADVRKFFRDVSIATMELDEQAADLLLDKGLYIRPPYVAVDGKREFIRGRDFMGSFFGAGERNLLAIEIGVLFNNIQNNVIGRTLLTGFAQTAESAVVRRYMRRGIEIATKHIEVLSALLRSEDVPVPAPWDAGVTGSTVAPFSDKLMMYHVSLLNQVGIAAAGTNTAAAMRKDLQTTYVRLAAEIGQYAADGANLMIENAWMEEPPKVLDHRELHPRQ